MADHSARIQIPNGASSGTPSSPEASEPGEESKRARVHPLGTSNGAHFAEDSNRPPLDTKTHQSYVIYRECQKNHAAHIGGHALDGCLEFLPSGEDGTIEALKCAACSCHRNFHRREVEGENSCACKCLRTPALSGPSTPALLALPTSRQIVSHAQMVMSLSSPPPHSDDPDAPHLHSASSRKKRFRTKFTSEQKEKMNDFAESLGWKISKHDEDAVQGFCNDVQVSRNVFKVWMHNNKAKKLENGTDPMKNCESPSDF